MRKYAMLACISALLSAALVSSQAPTVTPYPYVVIVKPNDMVTICDGEGCPYDNTLPDQTIYVAPDGCIDSDSMKQPISLNIPSLQTQAIPVQGDYVTCTPSGCIEGDQNVIFTISNAAAYLSNCGKHQGITLTCEGPASECPASSWDQ